MASFVLIGCAVAFVGLIALFDHKYKKDMKDRLDPKNRAYYRALDESNMWEAIRARDNAESARRNAERGGFMPWWH
jgi:hypothetical protein